MELRGMKEAETVVAADREYLRYLVQSTISGLEQLNGLGRQWNMSQKNASQLVSDELENLKLRRQIAESKRQCLLQGNFGNDIKKGESSILHELPPSQFSSSDVSQEVLPLDKSQTSVAYWKTKAGELDGLLGQSLRREESLFFEIKQRSLSLEQQQQQRRMQQDGEQQAFQTQLERLNNFVHFALRNAPIALVHFDKELRYRFLYNQYPGSGSQEMLGKTIEEIYSGMNLTENTEFKKHVLRQGVPEMREFTYHSDDFGCKSFLTYMQPVFSISGEALGLNALYMDISDQFHIREKLIRIREEEAVRKAMESEMYKTMRISEQTMKAKELLATMSREIRSPLSGVVSMAGLLAASDLDDEQRHLVEVMVGSGDLVLQLLEDIVDFSRAESGVPKLEETKFCPRDILKNILLIAAASLQNNLTLDGFVSKDVPLEVVGDVLRLRQILTNLVSNAVKFTHEGSIIVNMEVHQHAEMNDVVYVRCEVTDTGIGIPESALPSLFTKYMQASETHQRKYGGTGLGLAISKQLVELMGGTLEVRSKQSQGSTFSFVLPFRLCSGHSTCENDTHFGFSPAKQKLRKRPQQAVTNAEKKCENGSSSGRPKKEPKLLLAEDNKVNILVAQKMLGHFGLEASVVNNGVEAVRAAKEEHYDLIFMDVFMPEMDGLEATRLIRELQINDTRQQQHGRTAIVAMTANAFDEEACYANGMDSFITKPVTFNSIQRVIEQFLPKDYTSRYE